MHSVGNSDILCTLVHNNANTKVTSRKGTKIKFVEPLNENEIIYKKKHQINNVNLTEIHKLRKER